MPRSRSSIFRTSPVTLGRHETDGKGLPRRCRGIPDGGQAGRLVRNYHNVNWDVKRPGDAITLPVCVNQVNWKNDVYGRWQKAGYETDICIPFSGFQADVADYPRFDRALFKTLLRILSSNPPRPGSDVGLGPRDVMVASARRIE